MLSDVRARGFKQTVVVEDSDEFAGDAMYFGVANKALTGDQVLRTVVMLVTVDMVDGHTGG
jgi:hypothetical protein